MKQNMNKVERKSKIIAFFAAERERLVRYVRRFIEDTAERDGEDIVQDVMINIFARADVTIPIDNLAAYVYQSLRNRIVDYIRKRKDMVSLDESPVDGQDLHLSDIIGDPRYDWTSEEERLEIRERLFAALEELSDEQREVIIATEFEGWTFRELSEEWGVPLGTLLARKSRALNKIRDAFSDFGK
jgi:RNA polymerase sigma factor (sigma-70 family)